MTLADVVESNIDRRARANAPDQDEVERARKIIQAVDEARASTTLFLMDMCEALASAGALDMNPVGLDRYHGNAKHPLQRVTNTYLEHIGDFLDELIDGTAEGDALDTLKRASVED